MLSMCKIYNACHSARNLVTVPSEVPSALKHHTLRTKKGKGQGKAIPVQTGQALRVPEG